MPHQEYCEPEPEKVFEAYLAFENEFWSLENFCYNLNNMIFNKVEDLFESGILGTGLTSNEGNTALYF